MSNSRFDDGDLPVRRSWRLVLAALALGLAAMLVTVLAYRLSGPPLVKNTPQQALAQDQPRQAPAPAGSSVPGSMAGGIGMPVMDETGQAEMVAAMQALQANPNDVDALLGLADLFMARESYPNAQGFINRAMVAAPSDERPSYYQGVLQARQGQYEDAAASMERSLALRDNPATRYSLAVIYIYHLQAGDRGRAHLNAAMQDPHIPPELRTLIQAELDPE